MITDAMRDAEQHSHPSRAGNVISSPRPNARVYDQSISISGTIGSSQSGLTGRVIQAWIEKTCIGRTRIFARVTQDGRSGYKILAKLPEPITEARATIITIALFASDESDIVEIGRVPVELVPGRLRDRHYGNVVHPDQAKLLARENIYGSGPPVEHPSPEALELVLSHLPPKSSIIDVGCGAGAYGPGLINAGHRWLGLEVNDRCIDVLQRRELPFRRVKAATERFPCADSEFDHAICIEVLEHIADPASFLGETARVISGRAMFSVPNLEVIPFLKDWEVVPWHLLEADHKNFFTRASLRTLLGQYFSDVEVFSYGEHLLRTRDEIAVHAHLFAIADKLASRG